MVDSLLKRKGLDTPNRILTGNPSSWETEAECCKFEDCTVSPSTIWATYGDLVFTKQNKQINKEAESEPERWLRGFCHQA